jgi:hypothetical protein
MKTAERFWMKVNKDGPIDTVHGGCCWIWLAARKGRKGEDYGAFWVGGRGVFAHRWSYIEAHGEPPAGTEIDHLCRNRFCVNPEHLEAVSHSVNVLRGNGPTAAHARQTHCKHGHPLSGDNVRLRRMPPGGRTCVTCDRAKAQRRYYALKEHLEEAK